MTPTCPFVFPTGEPCRLPAGHDAGPAGSVHNGTLPEYSGALYNRRYPDASWSCTVDHRDGDGNPVPCPDSLTVPEPEPLPKPRGDWGCGVLPFVVFFLALLAGCSAQPAGNATPRAETEPGAGVPAKAGVTNPPAVLSQLGAPHERPFVIQVDARHDGGAPPLTPEVLAGGTTYSGRLAWADPKYGPRYLALREPRGTRVLVCGPADCVEMTSNDYGPVYSLWKQGRIADVAVAAWERICGVPRWFGLCPGSIQILRRPQIALPATSTGGEP